MIIHEIMETPEGINGKSIVDSICNILGQDEDTNDNAKHCSKHPKYFKFTALFTRSIDYHPICKQESYIFDRHHTNHTNIRG